MKIEELTENDVIHIRNKKEAKAILKLLYKSGFEWCGKRESTEKAIYRKLEAKTEVGIHFKGYQGNIEDWKDKNIIPASKFLKTSLKKRVKELEKEVKEIRNQLNNTYVDAIEILAKPSSDIEVHFDEVEKLPEQYPIGKWVKEPGIEFGKSLYYIVSIDKDKDINPVNSYGINRNGVWRDIDNRSLELTNWPLATDEEVKTALISEAERRGYSKDNVRVNSLGGNLNVTTHPISWDYHPKYNHLRTHNDCKIFEKGIWATIIEPEIDFSKAGQLVKSNDGKVLLYTTDAPPLDEHRFSAVVVESEIHRKGSSDNNWLIKMFTLCTEPVTLSN